MDESNCQVEERDFIIFKGQYSSDILGHTLVNICIEYPSGNIEWEVRKYDDVKNRVDFEQALWK